jgi:hypothetical protein
VVFSEDRTIASHIANWHDAMLIAAAPELLAACSVALEVVRRHNLDDYCGEDEITDPDGVKGIGDVLRAAIRKSEGYQ